MRRRWWLVSGLGLILIAASAFFAVANRKDDLDVLKPYVIAGGEDYNDNSRIGPVMRARIKGPVRPMITRTLRVHGITAEQLFPILQRHVARLGGWETTVMQYGTSPEFMAHKGQPVLWYGNRFVALAVNPKKGAEPVDFEIIEQRTASWWDGLIFRARKWGRHDRTPSF